MGGGWKIWVPRTGLGGGPGQRSLATSKAKDEGVSVWVFFSRACDLGRFYFFRIVFWSPVFEGRGICLFFVFPFFLSLSLCGVFLERMFVSGKV